MSAARHPAPALRLDADAEDVGRGLSRLVVALLEIVRELLERQAVRRMDSGSLSAEEVERLGRALAALRDQLAELRETLGTGDEDLRLPASLVDAFDGPDRPAARTGVPRPSDPSDLSDAHDTDDTSGRHS